MAHSKSLTRESFFTHDREFYRRFFGMMIIVALQNFVAYSVNMMDNIMLGSYNQDALSGAATVNQIFFIIQAFATATGTTLTTLCSQYWGKKEGKPIRSLAGIAMRFGVISGVGIIVICAVIPRPMLSLFTTSSIIIDQGQTYLSLIMWSFALYLLSNILYSLLRSFGTVRISFYVSLLSLVINVSINYTLSFGHFGFPEMGIRGAAVGTLIARIIEFCIVLFYLLRREKKIRFTLRDLVMSSSKTLRKDFYKAFAPNVIAQVVWSLSVPIQTGILGHMSDDALAANAVATTFFQYLKVIVQAMGSTAAVIIGNTIGEGKIEQVKKEARTISIMDLAIGAVLGLIIFLLRKPLLSLYVLTPTAKTLASHMIIIMSVVMVGMSYEMPVSSGILLGGGDLQYRMRLNLISTWLIVMPLSFSAAFWWKLPVEIVVIFIQSDQFFKGFPLAWRLHHYKWIHIMTKEDTEDPARISQDNAS